jgi:hypothetical protein
LKGNDRHDLVFKETGRGTIDSDRDGMFRRRNHNNDWSLHVLLSETPGKRKRQPISAGTVNTTTTSWAQDKMGLWVSPCPTYTLEYNYWKGECGCYAGEWACFTGIVANNLAIMDRMTQAYENGGGGGSAGNTAPGGGPPEWQNPGAQW